MSHREFKEHLHSKFARVGGALCSARRLELLDLLAQAPRHVEALAGETSMSVANVSQHLQTLRAARLVSAERQGTTMVYRLAGDDVLRLWLALRSVAETRLAEVKVVATEFAVEGLDGAPLSRDELERMLTDEATLLIDVRPSLEFAHGHLPGAISVPIEELPRRLHELPKGRRIVTYCRGTYCLFADEAVALLRAHGFEAVRIEGGWPEWLVEGRATAEGV
ncbi:MAG: ArsR/SmtB family transcription factor [Tepidiformaceae bacterium]